jgi:8-oxo-dGTP diphosphatase
MAPLYPKVGVACILLKGNKILMGKRKSSHGAGAWAPPGGHLEFGEEPVNAVVREVLEETGLKVTSPKFAAMTNDIFKEESSHYITLYFVCRYESGEARVMEPNKCEKWEWFEWNRLPEPLFLPIINLQKQNFNPLHHVSWR